MLTIVVEPHPYNPERWNILVEGELWREVHRTVFGKKLSFKPVKDWEEWHQQFSAYEYKRAKAYALWRLNTQSYHSEHLAKMMRDRLVDSTIIERLIAEFRSLGFLDDQQWIHSFIRSQQKRYSLKHIISKLYQKGLSQETLQEIAQNWTNPEEELNSIQKLLKSRYRSKNLTDFKERQKVIASLARKGFNFELIQSAMNSLELA